MSPYISPVEGASSQAGPSRPQISSPPVLASIGTVLIDAFDCPPRPVLDGIPTPPPTPTVRSDSDPRTPLSHSQNIFSPIPHLLSPSSPKLNGSRLSTPQLSFGDDSPIPNAKDVYEMLGGGALYALVGARLWLPSAKLKTLVDRSAEVNDLPAGVENKLASLGEDMWVWNRGKGTRMTRARIRYEGDVRFFQQIVRAPYRTISQLAESPLYNAEYLHISPPYSPEDVAKLQAELAILNESRESSWRPKIVFEPTPPSCHPGQKRWVEQILPGIEVLSPNHEELFSFYSIPTMSMTDPDLRPTVERIITHILFQVGIGQDDNGIVVVRCGRLGACVGTKAGGLKWCPAYFDEVDSDRVKDVTGAGNSFLGGYIAGLSICNDPYEVV
nr:uncharacterized protein CI109_006942 [Kwoniella shandongensis]KAA5524735.1 hypothetical protein CI109_006942 [Kwoniella shandongensis]